ncbi:Hypothetical protein A7982_03196 [Minicystis rosea]|nr:Hypothetical protein A7982_03196 [Minicystis rosea]
MKAWKAWIERCRKHQRSIAIVVVVLAWGIAFRSCFIQGWSNMFGSAAPPTRGNAVAIKDKDVETTAEQQKRLEKHKSEIRETLSGLKTDLLGDTRKTRGDTPRESKTIPRDVARYTQRDACFQMKLEYPDRFGDVDCMEGDYDDTEPWFKADRRAGQ